MKHDVGGAMATLTTSEISPEEVIDSVSDPGAGATVFFLGTVRDFGDSGSVREITYEAYAPLARKRLEEIAQEVLRRHAVRKVRIVHRIGRLHLQEVSVAIAVSSAHRQDAFEGCRYAIETIKKAVPIWKKERLSTGFEVWAEGREILDAKPAATR